MFSDTAVGYICTTVGLLGVLVVIAFVSYLVYLHESRVEENRDCKTKSDIYD